MQYIGLVKYGLKFSENCCPIEENSDPNGCREKIFDLFLTMNKKFELFLFVFTVKFLEVSDRKRKKLGKFFNT